MKNEYYRYCKLLYTRKIILFILWSTLLLYVTLKMKFEVSKIFPKIIKIQKLFRYSLSGIDRNIQPWATKGRIPYRDSFIMLWLNWQDNFKFLIQHRTQKKICSKTFEFELVFILWTNKENPSPLFNGWCWLRKILSPSWIFHQCSASLGLTAGVVIFWCWEHVLYRKFCRHQ